MASLMNKKYGADIKGIITIDENNNINVEVEDIGNINLANFISDFTDKENVKITISYAEEV